MTKIKGTMSDDVARILKNRLKLSVIEDLFEKDKKLFELSLNFNRFRGNYEQIALFKEFPKLFKDVDFSDINEYELPDLIKVAPDIVIPKLKETQLTRWVVDCAVNNKPSLFKKYDFPIKKLGTSAWIRLIKFKPEYVDLFLNNIDSIRSKTDLRHIFYRVPDKLFPVITEDQFDKCVLTAKEFMLLYTKAIRPKTYQNVELSKELKEHLDTSVTMEVFSGTSTLTSHLNKSKSIIGETNV